MGPQHQRPDPSLDTPAWQAEHSAKATCQNKKFSIITTRIMGVIINLSMYNCGIPFPNVWITNRQANKRSLLNACTVKAMTTIVSHAHPVIRGILAQCRIGFKLPTITRTSPPTLHSPIYIQSMFFHVHKLYLRAWDSREEGEEKRRRKRQREREGEGGRYKEPC